MWDRIKQFHRRSVTVGLAHALAWIGLAIEGLYQFPDVASSIGLAQYVPPSWLGVYTWVIAALTLAARLRTLRRTVS